MADELNKPPYGMGLQLPSFIQRKIVEEPDSRNPKNIKISATKNP
jgi:hypothetical protein